MIKFMAVFTVEKAMEAAKNDPDALQYVCNLDLFIKVANALGIRTDQS